MKFETVKVVGGTHHGEVKTVETGHRQMLLKASDGSSMEHYERVKKADGQVFYVYRPGR